MKKTIDCIALFLLLSTPFGCSWLNIIPIDHLHDLEKTFDGRFDAFVDRYNLHGGYDAYDREILHADMHGELHALNEYLFSGYLETKGDKESDYDLDTKKYLDIHENYKDSNFPDLRRNYASHFSEAMQFYVVQDAPDKRAIAIAYLDSLTGAEMTIAVDDAVDNYVEQDNFDRVASPVAERPKK